MGRLFVGIVRDEAQPRVFRYVGYVGLYALDGWRGTAPDSCTFRIPEDVDWELVDRYMEKAASAIETALYGNRGTHGVVEFALALESVRLRLAPWAEPSAWVLAAFSNAKLVSLETYTDTGDELGLPWDVLGFDSYEQGEGRWRFVLHCDEVEWCFESDWPSIEKSTCTDDGSDQE